jgi:CHAT domain-containing protein/Tfp pilus assembly protein PilF
VDSAKKDAPAARAGVKAGDTVAVLNAKKDPTLEEVLAYRFDWATARESALEFGHESETYEVRFRQGDWGCEFRPDFDGGFLKRLADSREALKKEETRDGARESWDGLSQELATRGYSDAALWLSLDLGKALREQRRWGEAEGVFDTVWANAPPGSFWRYYAAFKRAEVLASAGEYGRAVEAFGAVKALAEASGSEIRIAGALNARFVFEKQRGNLPDAKVLAEAALAIKERVAPGSLDLAVGLNNLGVLDRSRGDLASARAYFLRSKAIRERIAPGGFEVAVTLVNLGNVTLDQGDLATAKDCYLEALSILERLSPDTLALAGLLNNLGSVAWDQGDLAAARQFHIESLAIRERLAPGSLDVSMSLNNLGTLASAQGDWEAARQFHIKSLSIRERMAPESLDVAATLTNLGNAARRLGDSSAAWDFYLKALAIEERLAPESLELTRNLVNMGTLAFGEGDMACAEEFYRKAVFIQERLAPSGLDLAMSLYDLASVDLARGDLCAAREGLQRSLSIREHLAPGSLSVAESLAALAQTGRSYGDFPGSVELRVKAVEALESQRSRAGGEAAKSSFAAAQGRFYMDLVAAYLEGGQPERALETLERSRARALLEMVSSRYIDLKGEIPDELLERRLDLARQRKVLTDRLSEANVKSDPDEIDSWRAELLMLPQKEDALAEEIRKASPRLADLEYPKALNFEGIAGALEPGTLLLAFAVADKETYLFSLCSPGRTVAASKGDSRKGSGGAAKVQPAGSPEAIPRTDAGTASPHSRLRAIRLPIGRSDLEVRVRAFRSQLGPEAAAGPDFGAWRRMARNLYDTLLGQVCGEIAHSTRILLLPDGPLHLMPFAALIPSGDGLPAGLVSKPIGLQRPISVEASMTVYAELKGGNTKAAPAPRSTWVGFGDPVYAGPDGEGRPPVESAVTGTRGPDLAPLPGTRKEVEAVFALFGDRAQLRLGSQATEEAVRVLPRGTSFVHFACHALVDPQFPMHSALALSVPPPDAKRGSAIGDNRRDGLLQAWEIMQDVKLDSDCVVLSACGTGTGRILGGEGIMGLTRAFFYAGARSVMVSLWPISDESTALLMERYYREILSGASRDVALMRAQSSLAEASGEGSSGWPSGRDPKSDPPHSDFSHPFHWAAFELHGRGD